MRVIFDQNHRESATSFSLHVASDYVAKSPAGSVVLGVARCRAYRRRHRAPRAGLNFQCQNCG